MSLKNSNDTIENRTHDLPVYSVVPSPLRYPPKRTYIRINSTKSPVLSPDCISKPRLMSQVRSARRLERVDQCVSAVGVVEVQVFVRLRSSCSHVTEVGQT
jgi:hypothetical protein